MKRLKFSFAFIIAIVAVGFTIATKANLGKRAITGCFQVLTVTDGSADQIISQPNVLRPTCEFAQNEIASKQYVRSASMALGSESACPPADQFFCCVTLTAFTVQPAPGVPLLNLGDGLLRYYQINNIVCKETQTIPGE